MRYQIVIAMNPGTTTTRCAAYGPGEGGVRALDERTFEHPDEALAEFSAIADQFDYRLALVRQFASEVMAAHPDAELVGCAGRGGMLTPVPAGVIRVNPELVEFSLHTPVYQHSSNLGAPLAYALAQDAGCEAYIADPVAVDQLSDVARVAGSPDFKRFSFVHALNIRATARKLAERLGRPMEALNLVIAHLGAGFSIAAMHGGRLIDSSNRMECSPFTPERCGGLPPIPLIEACYSGRYSKQELLKRLYGEGGVFAYLGTRDMRKVEAMIEDGDQRAALVWEAMVYQIKKAIGVMAATMDFQLDGIVLTGGMVNSAKLSDALRTGCEKLAPVYRYPGSNETEALARAVFDVVLNGCEVMEWPVASPAPGITVQVP